MSNEEIIQIHIEPNTSCPGKCNFCPHNRVKRKETLGYDLFCKNVDEGRYLGCFNYTLFRLGDPLFFGDLFKWLDYLRVKHCTTDLFTNAFGLTDEKADKLIEYSDIINTIVFSVHGSNPIDYELIMGLDFSRTYDNIINFMEKKHQIPCEIFSLSKNITPERESEYKKLWQDYNFTSIALRNYVEWCGNIDDLANNNISKTRVPCVRLIKQLDIDCRGNVVLCCMDAFSDIIFGNISEESLQEILQKPLRQYYLEKHNSCQSAELPLCKNCSINAV